jgi:hypothetical protein
MATAEQQEQVVRQLELDRSGGAYSRWLDDLQDGCCRLPELTPEAGRDVLLAWLSPEVDGGRICRQCGMEYPNHRHPPLSEWRVLPGKTPLQGPPPWYDLPEFFQNCPGCGASRFEMDWPHLIEGKHYPWMEWDGYMGVQRRPRPFGN